MHTGLTAWKIDTYFHLPFSFGFYGYSCANKVVVVFFCVKFDLLGVQACGFTLSTEEQKWIGLDCI